MRMGENVRNLYTTSDLPHRWFLHFILFSFSSFLSYTNNLINRSIQNMKINFWIVYIVSWVYLYSEYNGNYIIVIYWILEADNNILGWLMELDFTHCDKANRILAVTPCVNFVCNRSHCFDPVDKYILVCLMCVEFRYVSELDTFNKY